jgi:protein CpxP
MKHSLKTLAAAAILAGTAFAVVAQNAPQPAPAPGGAPHMQRGGDHRMDPAKMQERQQRMAERMAKRLGEFKQKLAITPAQEGAWTAWTTALKPTGPMMQRPDRAEFAKLTTPERIDRMRAMRVARQSEMDKRMDATKVFYGALNAEQKKTFDEQGMRLMGGGKRGMRGGHGGHHGRG